MFAKISTAVAIFAVASNAAAIAKPTFPPFDDWIPHADDLALPQDTNLKPASSPDWEPAPAPDWSPPAHGQPAWNPPPSQDLNPPPHGGKDGFGQPQVQPQSQAGHMIYVDNSRCKDAASPVIYGTGNSRGKNFLKPHTFTQAGGSTYSFSVPDGFDGQLFLTGGDSDSDSDSSGGEAKWAGSGSGSGSSSSQPSTQSIDFSFSWGQNEAHISKAEQYHWVDPVTSVHFAGGNDAVDESSQGVSIYSSQEADALYVEYC